MELPLGGPALRHYTQSRPRPHRQKLNYRPTRIQETIIECENEDFELMGRVDEGVEEFFTKKVLPAETLKKGDDEEEEEEEETITVHEVAPVSTVPCPPPTKTLRRKLGDFFTLKKRRGLKSEPSQEGRPKKTSIADFIRPLRDVARGEKDKDKDKVKEHDRENEKEKGKEGTDTGDAVQGISISDAPPMRGEAVPPRRALREGKSQSLILLSGSASGPTRNKKLDGQNSFEQKLQLMLQRIGVSKPQTGETQNHEGEMKKAESEGTIIDSKQDAPSTKPRTMSASSDTRHQLRSSVSAHESAGKPPLLPKPVIKAGPPATISGRNTPENELSQIEGLPNAETAPVVSTCSTSTVATVSDTALDSATILPSSTVTPTDTHVCTDVTAETTASADISSQDGTVIPESPSPTIKKTLASTATPATPTPEQDGVAGAKSNALDLTPTVSTLSSTTLETISGPSDNNTTTVTDLATELTPPEPDASEINAAPTSTSTSNIPASQSVNVVVIANDGSTPCTLPTSLAENAIISQGDESESEAPSLSISLITVTSTIAAETCAVTTSPSCTLPETTSSICTAAKTESPTFTTCTISSSIISSSSTVNSAPTPITSCFTSATQKTETHQTTTVSTAISPVTANSEHTLSTAVHSVTVNVSTTEFQHVPFDHLTTHDLTEKLSGQEHEQQTSPPEASVTECSMSTTEIVGDVITDFEETKTTDSNEKRESDTETENKTEEPTLISSEVIVQDSEEKLKEETGNLNAEADTLKGTSDENTGDEVINGDQKQDVIKYCD